MRTFAAVGERSNMSIEKARMRAAAVAERLGARVHGLKVMLDRVRRRAHELVRAAAPSAVAEQGRRGGASMLA